MEPDGDRVPIRVTTAAGRALAVLRIAFGLTFLWAFVDKVFGLGYATPLGKGWIDGGDPTGGFLGKGSNCSMAGFYHSLVGDFWVSPLFMIGIKAVTRQARKLQRAFVPRTAVIFRPPAHGPPYGERVWL